MIIVVIVIQTIVGNHHDFDGYEDCYDEAEDVFGVEKSEVAVGLRPDVPALDSLYTSIQYDVLLSSSVQQLRCYALTLQLADVPTVNTGSFKHMAQYWSSG